MKLTKPELDKEVAKVIDFFIAEGGTSVSADADSIISELSRNLKTSHREWSAVSILAAARRLGYKTTRARYRAGRGDMKSESEAGYYPAEIIIKE